jgi:hypothetical protein
MKFNATVLVPFVFFPFILTAQITLTVVSRSDSAQVLGVVCTNTKTSAVVLSDKNGKAKLTKGASYVLVHPSFMQTNIEKVQADTTIYLAPLVRDIEEVEIVFTTNEKLFEKVIARYRTDTKNTPYKGQLFYKNTNWFKYIYKAENVTDSASCSIDDLLYFDYSGASQKSKIQFSPSDLNRFCNSFHLEKNQKIQTSEISAFSKYDFSHFLDAIFTKDSYFDKIGFEYTVATRRIDTLNNTVELKFSSKTLEKTVVFSALDSTLISYQHRNFGKLGGYHYYFATFDNQKVQSVYEEKGFLFAYDSQDHQFVSIHYGRFEVDSESRVSEPAPFAEIIKSQINSKSEKLISELFPLYEDLLNQRFR